MGLKYTDAQRKEYLHSTRKIGFKWLSVFDGNAEFYAAYYWDVLTEMWLVERPVMVSDALKYMRSIKSPFTARKYLQNLLDAKLIIETPNPKDERSMLVSLSADMKKKLDKFFDETVDEMVDTVKRIKS